MTVKPKAYFEILRLNIVAFFLRKMFFSFFNSISPITTMKIGREDKIINGNIFIDSNSSTHDSVPHEFQPIFPAI